MKKTLLYDLENIWNEKRQVFMSSYNQELAATHLLCKLDLSTDQIQNLFKKCGIDLDVADSRGNTRLMISSVILFLDKYFILNA